VQTDISYRLVLASASPARRALLKAAAIDVDVLVSGVDESVVEADDAYTLSLALARMKARTVAAGMQAQPGVLILGCDSVLAFDGAILGKPADAEDAIKRWQAMRGRSGVLHTGHHLTDLVGGHQAESPERSPSTVAAGHSWSASRATRGTSWACPCRCCAGCSPSSAFRSPSSGETTSAADDLGPS
jgi:MAF protein